MTLSMPNNPVERTPIVARQPILKVVGLGGGGSNAINRMIELGLSGVDFIAANTDGQALSRSLASKKIQLGPSLTRGLGAGGNPEIGAAAAEESIRELKEAMAGADMVFLTAGMGGGTGTGAISVAARVARSIGAVTIAIVTTPFSFEVGRRQTNARNGLNMLRPHTDTLITVPNDRLLQVAPRDLTLELAFRLADDVLRQGIQGITELITTTGVINVDFSHIQNMMRNGGGAILSIGYGQGSQKALKAVHQALHHPILEAIPVESASGIIANFSGGNDLSFIEVSEALCHLQDMAGTSLEIIPGVTSDENLHDRCQVILVITGLGATAVENISSQVAVRQTNSQPVSVYSSPRPSQPAVMPEMQMAAAQSDLDIPAFMRRRMH
jgi:cell division protein FtsZ